MELTKLIFALGVGLFVLAAMVLSWRYGAQARQPEVDALKQKLEQTQAELQLAQGRSTELNQELNRHIDTSKEESNAARRWAKFMNEALQDSEIRIVHLEDELTTLRGQLAGSRARSKRKEKAAERETTKSHTDEL